MTFSEKFIDHVIIDEQFINAYITIRDHLCLKEKKTVDILDCEKQVDTAIREYWQMAPLKTTKTTTKEK